jgi:hypothetical protein
MVGVVIVIAEVLCDFPVLARATVQKACHVDIGRARRAITRRDFASQA